MSYEACSVIVYVPLPPNLNWQIIKTKDGIRFSDKDSFIKPNLKKILVFTC